MSPNGFHLFHPAKIEHKRLVSFGTDRGRIQSCSSISVGMLFVFLLIGSRTTAMQPLVIARGNYPDIAVGPGGNIFVAYGRDGRIYCRQYDTDKSSWQPEQDTTLQAAGHKFELNRADPDIVVDRLGRPHIYAWGKYAYRTSNGWVQVPLVKAARDVEMAIDSDGTVYLTMRGGLGGGNLGLQKRLADSPKFVACTDPDLGLTSPGISNHVYSDIAVSPVDDSLHIIQRHGPGWTTAYRRSRDGGKTYDLRNVVSRHEPEAPHIVVDNAGCVFATHGHGEFFRQEDDRWISEGSPITCGSRDQPELAVDAKDSIYVAAFGGQFNARVDGAWRGVSHIRSVSGEPVGFVEMAACPDGMLAVWEEGPHVENDELAEQPGEIVVASLTPPAPIKQFACFDTTVVNRTAYEDPYRDVEMEATFRAPDGASIRVLGFYDGGPRWRVRFRPEQPGRWQYAVAFSDRSVAASGTFSVSESSAPFGPVRVSAHNPVWFTRGQDPFFVRAFHAGDRFFAANWSDEARDKFLDWFQTQGYNTISVAHHYLNRDAEDRGRGWETPRLWPLAADEYRRMERILDDLAAHGIVVFPFAGFIGQKSNYPRQQRANRFTSHIRWPESGTMAIYGTTSPGRSRI